MLIFRGVILKTKFSQSLHLDEKLRHPTRPSPFSHLFPMLFPPGTSSKRRSTTKEESSEVKHSWPSKVKYGSEATNRHQPWDKSMEIPNILDVKNGHPITSKTEIAT